MPISSINEPHLLLRADMEAAESISIGQGTGVAFSKRCPNRQTDNEDGVLLVACGSQQGILAVADGFGGQRSGDDAADAALRALVECWGVAQSEGGDLRHCILNGFERANQAVCALGVGAATTLAVVEIDGDQVRPYHAGDSEILVVGSRGKVKFQTLAHGPVAYAVEAGWIEPKEALHHEDRHIVSNMVGTNGMRIDIGSSLTLDAMDTVLIATDGVYDNLHLDEIVSCIRRGTPADAAARLAEACLSRMTQPMAGLPSKPDDLTFILFRLDS